MELGPRSRSRTVVWLVTVTLTGAVLMGLEMVAFRLYAPYFGYSTYVWGSMISVVMLAMSCGYALGGRVADRSRDDTPLYGAILFSALYQLLAIYAAGKLLPALARMGEFTGTTLATLLVFALPMTALASTGPFVIRLLADGDHVGSAAGAVYALSTMGSIAGVLATTYWLVPTFGTQATMRAVCGATAMVAVLGLAARRPKWLPFVLALAAAACASQAPAFEWRPMGSWPASTETVWTTESPYNLIRVMRVDKWFFLLLNDGRTAQTARQDGNLWSRHYHDMFAAGPLLAPARSLLVLGLGGGGSVAATRLTAPDIQVDAVEIDPQVVEAGRRYFGLRVDDPRLRIHVADARRWLGRNRSAFDIVQVDLYQGGPYVPFYLTTLEFFGEVREHMAPGGLLMNNVFDAGSAREILMATVATMRRVFPAVMVFSDDAGSHSVLGFRDRQSVAGARERLLEVPAQSAHFKFASRVAARLREVVPPSGTPVFTDDRAPIDGMIRRMMTGYHAKRAD
jgi:spermidine synthase